MPPSIAKSEKSDRLIRSNALNAKKVNAIPSSAVSTAIKSVKGVLSKDSPLIKSSTTAPASAPMQRDSILYLMPLPRFFWYRSCNAKPPPNITTEIKINV